MLVLAAGASRLQAQTAAEPPKEAEESVIQLDRLVVTGSVAPRSVLESPLSITMIDLGAIERLQPRGIDELLRKIPGLYIEAAGGESNNNLFSRGVFSTGGFYYVAMQEDGLPVISESEMAFSSADNYTRLSSWIARVEGLRGGSSGVFQSSAPIGTVNMIGREGPKDGLHGQITVQTGDYGLFRNELWVGGPLGKDTTFAVGGFFRTDQGIRDPGFTADKGGQLNANVRHEFANGKGYFKVLGKLLSDRTEFAVPTPMTGSGSNPVAITGGPAVNGSSASVDTRRFFLPGTPDGALDYDLADGIHVELGYIGTEFEIELTDGLKVQNRNRYTQTDKSMTTLIFGAPTPLQTIANNLAGGPTGQYAAAYNAATGNFSFRLNYPGQAGAVAAANATAAAALNNNGLGSLTGYWFSGAELRNFQNDLRIIQSFNDANSSLTVGVYYSNLNDARHWQWNNYFLDVSPSYHRLDLTYLDATTGAPVGQYTYNGIQQAGTFYRNDKADVVDTSVFVNVDHKVGKLTLDAGYRFQHMGYNANVEDVGFGAFNVNNPAGTSYPALMNASFGNGKFTTASAKANDQAMTVGANYAFNRRTSAFARYSKGPRMQRPDEIMDAARGATNVLPPAIDITQYEAGLKYARSGLAFFLTAFQIEQRNILQNDFITGPNGSIITQNSRLDVDAKGFEVEGVWTVFRGLSFTFEGVLQEPEIVSKIHLLGSNGQPVSIQGNQPYRVPKVYGAISGSYRFPSSDRGEFEINASWRHTGKRQVDLANSSTLGAFNEIGAGASYTTKGGIIFRANVQNLTNSLGLTEGDPRSGTVQSNAGSIFNARAIFPRSVVVSATYSF